MLVVPGTQIMREVDVFGPAAPPGAFQCLESGCRWYRAMSPVRGKVLAVDSLIPRLREPGPCLLQTLLVESLLVTHAVRKSVR